MFKNDTAGSGLFAGSGDPPGPRCTFRLIKKAQDRAEAEDIEFDAAGIPEAIETAIQEFGSGEVEVHVAGGRSYLLRIAAHKAWSLEPLYNLKSDG